MESLKKYSEINCFDLNENVFDLLDNQWMLITAGTADQFNTMTASWGGFGFLWNKTIVTIFIRPQRHTYKFVNESSGFNLSFFSEKYKPALNFCGSKSGRNYDKPKEVGLTPAITPNGFVSFQEARITMDCKKLYVDDLNPDNFIDLDLRERIYPTGDYHRFYIGEILGCFSISE